MAGLLDWLTDSGIFGGGVPSMNPVGDAGGPGGPPAPSIPPPSVNPMGDQTGFNPQIAAPPFPPGSDPMTAGGAPGNGPGLPYPPGTDPMTAGNAPPPGVPMPQARPAGAPPAASPGGPMPSPGVPMPQGPGGGAPPAQQASPGGTFISRALGISPEQSQQMGSGLAAGLKSVGQNWNKPGLAAFSGSAGAAMEGSQKRQDVQSKQMTDYLNSAIKAKQAGDEGGYKRSYVKYLAAKLQADTDRFTSKDAAGSKNDSPTQLYLSAERLIQADPEVRDAAKAVSEARKGNMPDEAAKAQATLQQIVAAKQAQHWQALGLNPQTAAQIGKQSGNARDNPIDAGKMGVTKDNIAQKLQPGQYYTNPSDGQVYQYKGPPEGKGTKKGGMPDKPTSPGADSED